VVGIDRLGRNAAEVMMTIRDLGERGIVLRSLREGIDTSNATGRMVARHSALGYQPPARYAATCTH
jgi:DNA invertase Pin-like site-specific DNA recombinase